MGKILNRLNQIIISNNNLGSLTCREWLNQVIQATSHLRALFLVMELNNNGLDNLDMHLQVMALLDMGLKDNSLMGKWGSQDIKLQVAGFKQEVLHKEVLHKEVTDHSIRHKVELLRVSTLVDDLLIIFVNKMMHAGGAAPMNKIIDGLYLGNLESASEYGGLVKNGITHILTVAVGIQPVRPHVTNIYLYL